MKNKRISVLLASVLLGASAVASAQMPSLGGMLGGGKSSGASAEQIVSKYVAGTQNVMKADANMLAAVGLKDEADKVALHAKNLTEGATKDALEGASKLQSDSSKALEQQMSGKKVVMDAASKKQFAEGVQDLSKGVIQYVGMSKDVTGFKPSVTSMGGAAAPALFVVQNLPGSIKSLASTLKLAIEFSKTNNIPLPKEANDATSML
ncbi:hypothetical protein [Janthinobacterium fluminis]|uniref:DUF4142 domain-containing protein n=1 Tax=Janthinobacterium fluminis TaxID=2987524 RepID=A0ABT5JZW8_9BURK|nr:hypothetical protein [Janthinobacterium fluminis]MDC8758144.1 hypothetical protein [Janthinobacterium fluminis]